MRVRVGAEHGVAMGWLDLPWPGVEVFCQDRRVPSQWVRDDGPSGGMLLLAFAAAGDYAVVLQPKEATPCAGFSGVVAAAVSAVHDPSRGAFPQWNGLPMAWDDSIRERVPGAVEYPEGMPETKYCLTWDRDAAMALVADGPIAGVVRTRSQYCSADGEPAPAAPGAVYDWYYFRHMPVVWVRCRAWLGQDRWRGMRFAAVRVAGLDQWCAGFPREDGVCTADMRPVAFDQWAMVHDGARAVGVICGSALIEYDKGHGSAGLVADGGLARLKDRTPAQIGVEEASAFFWVGPCAPESVAQLYSRGSLPLDARFTRDEPPASDLVLEGGALSLGVCVKPDGAVITRLSTGSTSWLPQAPLPVFTVAYGTEREGVVHLDADRDWGKVEVRRSAGQATVRFSHSPKCPGAAVDWVISQDPGGLEMHLEIEGPAVRGAVFPRLTVGEPEGGGTAFVPAGQGRLEAEAFRRNTRYRMPYAGPFAAMSFMGVYGDTGAQAGIYLAWHDPQATRKDLMLDSLAHRRAVVMEAGVPAEGMGRTQRWTTPAAVLRASTDGWWGLVEHYRGFAQSAPWWAWEKPARTWIDDTDWWLIASVDRNAQNAMQLFVDQIAQAADAVGVPPAVHGYNWHEIPFDNDYPHYLPARPGFAQALQELKRRGIHVTPYINGRLWDTRDRGLEDWQFTAVARPAATKDEAGNIVCEIYGTKEADGSYTRLGVMCPATALWQDKIADLVRQLTFDLGASGVYIDQIAAMAAVLCCDETHGHPLGGGGWWRAGYGSMLRKTRAASDQAPLTTECNAEPYVGWLDAYLMWHCMFPGQVPAFSAVYSSRVRLFGRASVGDADALWALTAQSWVYGEQVGWFSPGAVHGSGEGFTRFLTEAVRLRAAVRDVIQQGRMLMPPRLSGGQDRAYAWGWDPRRTVLPPVQASLWRLGDDTVLLLTNHSGATVTATWDFDAAHYGYEGPVSARRISAQSEVIEEHRLPARGRARLAVQARTASVWRLCAELQ